MKLKRNDALFGIGLLLQTMALFGDHAMELPFVLRVVAPSYCRANSGLERLLETRSLSRTSEGFRELEPCLAHHARTNLHHAFTNEVIVTIGDLSINSSMSVGGTMVNPSVSYTGKVSVVGMNQGVTIHGGNTFGMPVKQLRDKVDALKDPNLLLFCVVVFSLGTLVEIVAFMSERSNEVTKAAPSKPSEQAADRGQASQEHHAPESDKKTTPENHGVGRENAESENP